MPNENVPIKVLFFSQLREITGTGETQLTLSTGATIGDLLRQLYACYPALEKWDGSILLGAGVEFVGRDYVIRPNDEIAIMPPVQGG